MTQQSLSKTCSFCKKDFIPKIQYESRTSFCGKQCQKSFWYHKERYRLVSYPEVATSRKCICEKVFIPDIYHPKAKTCSTACQKRLDYFFNKETRIRKISEWIKQNKEKVRSYHRKNYANNIHRKRAQARARSTGHISLEIWKKICVNHGNMCAHCEKTGDYNCLTIDHIVPFSLGGSNEWWNLQPLCLRCNQIKGNRFIG